MISPGARYKHAVGEGLVFIFSFRDPWCKMVKEPCSFGSHGGRPSPEVKCKSWRVGTKPSCSVLGDQKYDCHMVLKIWKSSTGEIEAGGLWVTHNEFQASLWCRARSCYKTAKQRGQTKSKHRPWVKEHQKPPSRSASAKMRWCNRVINKLFAREQEAHCWWALVRQFQNPRL